jgi:hypothetical protein
MKLDSYKLSVEGSSQAVGHADGQGDTHTSEPGRDSDFRAVEGGAETMNGGALLVEAYAALWLILFGFVWMSWRKQMSIDARVAELERSMSTAPRGSAK